MDLSPPLSLRRGSISNLRSSIGVVTGIMFQKALWNSLPNLGAFTAPCNKQNKSQPSITMDFQKIREKKKTKQSTPSPRSSSHDQPGGRSNRTPPRAQVSSSQPIVNRFLGTISSIPCQPGHSPLPNHHLYNLLPSIPVRETGLPCTQPPPGEHDQTK